jgi:hypothetical protein
MEELAGISMRGKFGLVHDDFKAKNGDPSSRLDQDIWVTAHCKKIREKYAPQLEKLFTELEAKKEAQGEALKVLMWLRPQRNATELMIGKLFLLTRFYPQLPRNLWPELPESLFPRKPSKETLNNEEPNG